MFIQKGKFGEMPSIASSRIMSLSLNDFVDLRYLVQGIIVRKPQIYKYGFRYQRTTYNLQKQYGLYFEVYLILFFKLYY